MFHNKSVDEALALIQNDKSKVLGLTVGSHQDVTPGQYIPRADAQSPPQISLTSASSNQTYFVVGLDIDAPFPSLDILGPILHWLQPGFQASSSGGTSPTALSTSTPFIANYIGPAPPPLSGPHRYIFLLYEQPAGLDVAKYAPAGGKTVPNTKRIRYDLNSFEKEIGLGQVLAANYFTSN